MKAHNVRWISSFLGTGLAAGGWLGMALLAHAATYDVNVASPTLYTDPCTGNDIKVGGFSGLFPVPGCPDQLYVITDRGPNPDYLDPDGNEYKLFPVPYFGPNSLTLQWNPATEEFDVVAVLPLTKPDGGIVTGLPNNPPKVYGVGYGMDPADIPDDPVPNDSDALDTEGLTMDSQGNFWVSEEYRPSIAMVSPSGEVLLRLVPDGTLAGDETVPTLDVLPAVLAKRRNNRGLEGIAATQNDMLYAIMQRPLSNPNSATGNKSQNIRIVEVNLKELFDGKCHGLVRQLIYRTEPSAAQSGVYASDLFSLTPSRFLVPERSTDKLFVINLAPATDITLFEDAAGFIKPEFLADPGAQITIEMLDSPGLAALGIKTVQKAVVLDSLTAIDSQLEKCEGVCIAGDSIVLVHDNDFNLDVSTFSEECDVLPIMLQDPPNLPKVSIVPLPEELGAE